MLFSICYNNFAFHVQKILFFVFYNFFPDFLMLCNARHVFQLNHKNLDIWINFLLFKSFDNLVITTTYFFNQDDFYVIDELFFFFFDHFLQHVIPVTFSNIILKTLIFDTVRWKDQKPKSWQALHSVKRAIYQENMTCYVISSHFYIRDMLYGHKNIKYRKI